MFDKMEPNKQPWLAAAAAAAALEADAAEAAAAAAADVLIAAGAVLPAGTALGPTTIRPLPGGGGKDDCLALIGTE